MQWLSTTKQHAIFLPEIPCAKLRFCAQLPPMFAEHLAASAAAIQSLASIEAEVMRAAALMSDALRCGCKIMSCGNGGSAAEAAHFSTELLCRLDGDRPSLASMNLTADGSFMTATANDYSFQKVFARQIEGLGRKGDVLLALTTSGNSPNILEAMEAARARGMRTVALLGKNDGGKARALADVALVVPCENTMHIQEAHLALVHILCWQIEHSLFPKLK